MNTEMIKEPKMNAQRVHDTDLLKKAIETSVCCFILSSHLQNDLHNMEMGSWLKDSAFSIYDNILRALKKSNDKELMLSMNTARRSVVETAGILRLLSQKKLINEKNKNDLLDELDQLNHQLYEYHRNLPN